MAMSPAWNGSKSIQYTFVTTLTLPWVFFGSMFCAFSFVLIGGGTLVLTDSHPLRSRHRELAMRDLHLNKTVFIFFLVFVGYVRGEATENDTQQNGKDDPAFDPSNEDWGSYHDPMNVFCGKYDCYKILGFDYESFGKDHPTTREITKRYRSLSRYWHPDKSQHKDAKSRFVKISRAYEVLTTVDLRKEYDDMRYDQEKYFQKHGTSVMWSYAPQSDAALVIIILFLAANIFSWYAQKHRWQLIADRLVKAAVENWTPAQGGTPESKELREQALGILTADAPETEKSKNGTATTTPSPKAPGKKAKRATSLQKKNKKQETKEALLPVVKALVNEMHDFGGGFHKPTWRDLIAVTLVLLPFKVGSAAWWQTKYMIRRMRKEELNDEEREVLTRRAVGPVCWDTATEEEQQAWLEQELWVSENLVEWTEEQEVKKLSQAEQKHYYKLKKKGQLDKLEKYE